MVARRPERHGVEVVPVGEAGRDVEEIPQKRLVLGVEYLRPVERDKHPPALPVDIHGLVGAAHPHSLPTAGV